MNKKAVVVLPTYNESKNIADVIDKIFIVASSVAGWDFNIVVVDSSSPDNTADVVKSAMKKYPNLYLISTKKEGLGKAYIVGFTYAIERLNPYILFEMDSDLSHDPDDIPKFIEKITNGADFVVGSRYIPGGSIPKDWGWDRKFYSILANLTVRIGFMKFSTTEWTNGYRAIKTWLVKKYINDLQKYTGYVFQVAFLDMAIKSGAHMAEVPVHFTDRKEGVSKINSKEYIFQTLYYVFRKSSFIKFAIVGLIGFTIDFSISYFLIEILSLVVWLSTLMSAETAIISNFIFNNHWSFRHKKLDNGEQNIIWSFIKFNLIASGSLIIQTVGMTLTTHFLGRSHWYIYKVFIIAFIIIPYSYLLYNKLVWKDK